VLPSGQAIALVGGGPCVVVVGLTTPPVVEVVVGLTTPPVVEVVVVEVAVVVVVVVAGPVLLWHPTPTPVHSASTNVAANFAEPQKYHALGPRSAPPYSDPPVHCASGISRTPGCSLACLYYLHWPVCAGRSVED
jgi:hypothetical protein